MVYKKGVTCVYNGHNIVLYSVVITWQSNPLISRFNSPCNEFTVFGQCVYTIFKFKMFSLKQVLLHRL